ncbi:MAG: arylesterase [Sphingomonadales bacterium]
MPELGGAARLYQMAVALGALFMSQAAVARPLTVLAYGDSLTAGYQLPPGQGFAPQLEKALKAKGHDVTVVGAGVSGDTSTQGRARLNWVLGGMKARPDLVVLELGANDMLRGQPPKTARENIDAMVKAFKARGARVLLAGMRANPALGKPYVAEFEGLFPAVAKANGVALYPFFLDGVAAQPGVRLADGMHPNEKGVAIIVSRILPSVERELKLVK